MGLRDRLRRLAAPAPAVHVADPRFEDWTDVRTFEDVETARAHEGHLRELGLAAALVADHPPDRFGRGDIVLVVRPEDYGEAEAILSGWDG